jgi:hypothetical protein
MARTQNKRAPEKRVGRKVVPPKWITAPEEVQMTLDLVQLSLEASAAQLFRCGHYGTSEAVKGIARQIPDLKKLARPR